MPYDTAEAATLFLQALQDIIASPSHAHAIAERAIAAHVMARMGVATIPEGRIGVKIPPLAEGERGWAKWVIGVNPSGKGGYLFEGPFLKRGQMASVIPGAIVIWTVPEAGTKLALRMLFVDDGAPSESTGIFPRSEWGDLARGIAGQLAKRD